MNLCNLRGPSLSALTLHPVLLSNQGSVQQPSDRWRCLLTLYYCPCHQVPGSTCLMLHRVACRHAAVVSGILHCSSRACPFGSALAVSASHVKIHLSVLLGQTTGVGFSRLGIPAPVCGAQRAHPWSFSHPYPDPRAKVLSLVSQFSFSVSVLQQYLLFRSKEGSASLISLNSGTVGTSKLGCSPSLITVDDVVARVRPASGSGCYA